MDQRVQIVAAIVLDIAIAACGSPSVQTVTDANAQRVTTETPEVSPERRTEPQSDRAPQVAIRAWRRAQHGTAPPFVGSTASYFDTASPSTRPLNGFCRIDHVRYDAGALNPTNACQSCQPDVSKNSWTSVADGTSCNDNNLCTLTDSCQAGACVGSNPVACTASDPCHVAGTCDPSTGGCSNPPIADGTPCDDANACTPTSSCQSGTCVGMNPVVCTALDACHLAGTCDPSTGSCSNPVAPDGTACNDGNACTQTDSCQSGACTGSNPVTCTVLDPCHVAGMCDPSTGTCSNPPAADGTACNDGSLCTQTDLCQSGVCTGSNPVICTALDQCHDAGSCDPANGTCSNPAKPNGSSCTAAQGVNGECLSSAGVCVPLPVAYYPFSGNANDASGNGNDGTVVGATLTTDRSGNANSAYAFDGASYIQLANESHFDFSTFTVAAWVEPTTLCIELLPHSACYQTIAAKGDYFGNYAFELARLGGASYYYDGLVFDTATGNWSGSDATPVLLSTWTHVAVTFDGTTARFYVNAMFTSSIVTNATPAMNDIAVRIGNTATGANGYNGGIDEVRFYNLALSDSQVAALP